MFYSYAPIWVHRGDILRAIRLVKPIYLALLHIKLSYSGVNVFVSYYAYQ